MARILHVDDKHEWREVVSRALADHPVDVAGSDGEALGQVQSRAPSDQEALGRTGSVDGRIRRAELWRRHQEWRRRQGAELDSRVRTAEMFARNAGRAGSDSRRRARAALEKAAALRERFLAESADVADRIDRAVTVKEILDAADAFEHVEGVYSELVGWSPRSGSGPPTIATSLVERATTHRTAGVAPGPGGAISRPVVSSEPTSSWKTVKPATSIAARKASACGLSSQA